MTSRSRNIGYELTGQNERDIKKSKATISAVAESDDFSQNEDNDEPLELYFAETPDAAPTTGYHFMLKCVVFFLIFASALVGFKIYFSLVGVTCADEACCHTIPCTGLPDSSYCKMSKTCGTSTGTPKITANASSHELTTEYQTRSPISILFPSPPRTTAAPHSQQTSEVPFTRPVLVPGHNILNDSALEIASPQQFIHNSIPAKKCTLRDLNHIPKPDSFEGMTPINENSIMLRTTYEGDNSTALRYCLPSVLGICCVHAGTTTMSNYMDQHPQLSFGARKEHRYFGSMPSHDATNDLLDPNLYQYAQGFPIWDEEEDKDVTFFDFSPMYLGHVDPKDVLETLGEDTKIILLVREAAYQTCFQPRFSWVKRQQAITARPNAHNRNPALMKIDIENLKCLGQNTLYANTSSSCNGVAKRFCYVNDLDVWSKTFPLENFLLISWAEVTDGTLSTQELLDKVAQHIGVSRFEYPAIETGINSTMHQHPTDLTYTDEQTKLFEMCLQKQRAPGSFLSTCDSNLWANVGNW